MFFTKKRILIGSFMGFALLVLIRQIQVRFNFFGGSECGIYVDNSPIIACALTLIFYILAFSIPVFVFGLILYKMKEDVFLLWRKFTFIYLVSYLFIMMFAPWKKADFISFDKGFIFIILISLYFIISLLIIIIKSFILHKKQKLN